MNRQKIRVNLRGRPALCALGLILLGCGSNASDGNDVGLSDASEASTPGDTGVVQKEDGRAPEVDSGGGLEDASGETDVGTGTPEAGEDTGSGNPVDSSAPPDTGTVADTGVPPTDGGGYKPCPGGGAPCIVMPLGDSITYGFGSTVSSSVKASAATGGGYRVELFTEAVAANQSITFVGSQMTGPVPDTVSGKTFPEGNEGHSGYSMDGGGGSAGALAGTVTDHALATYKPNIILLMIGTNDMHYSIDLANAPTRLGNLLDEITTDSPNALLVVAQIIAAKGAQDTATQAYNAAIPGVVQPRQAKGKHIVMVDMYSALKAWSTTNYYDSEHTNDTGYALMGQTWYAAIKDVLP
jgi:lysophospholipase L1-like esterase